MKVFAISSFFVAVAVAATTTTSSTVCQPTMGLNDYAKQAGKKYFGTAADLPESGEMTDKYYMKQFNNTHDFGQATAANVMKVGNPVKSQQHILTTTVGICRGDTGQI